MKRCVDPFFLLQASSLITVRVVHLRIKLIYSPRYIQLDIPHCHCPSPRPRLPSSLSPLPQFVSFDKWSYPKHYPPSSPRLSHPVSRHLFSFRESHLASEDWCPLVIRASGSYNVKFFSWFFNVGGKAIYFNFFIGADWYSSLSVQIMTTFIDHANNVNARLVKALAIGKAETLPKLIFLTAVFNG